MAGKVVELQSIIEPDRMATEIARNQYTWHMLRQNWMTEKSEIRQYIYATSTTKTSNSKLPWKNTTTIPKLCQIRDNLQSNYQVALFPKKKWVLWEADDKSSNTKAKREAITSYMCYVIAQREFKNEIVKCIQDYIDYGNCFAMPVWIDERVETKAKTKVGYVGPGIRRISPVDIVFNPIAPSFKETPKIVRSIVSLGEVKKMLQSLSNDENREANQKLYDYLLKIRRNVQGYGGELLVKDEYYNVDGFTSYQLYLQSNYCEVLTFYGDLYDADSDTFYENKIITIVDRHKVIDIKDNPSWFGTDGIQHVGWRKRADNLWAMGPLDNLVGMQYRIDHLENLKADVMDLIAYPVLKISGYVDDFEWAPMAKIHIGDKDGDVEMLAPGFQVLQLDQEIQFLMAQMEEMAGAPKEAMGFRTPGEKTKYEVQRMENAASRIFQNKTGQFEEDFVEPLLNGMMEQAKRFTTSDILVKYFDDEFKQQKFMELTPDDITGAGRIKPYAARHFAEQAELTQNLSNYFASPLGQLTAPHWSTIKLAQMFEDLFDVSDYNLVQPYVADAEAADRQKLSQALQEQVLMEFMSPSGLTPDDTRQGFMQPGPQGPMPMAPPGPGNAPPTPTPTSAQPKPGFGLPQPAIQS